MTNLSSISGRACLVVAVALAALVSLPQANGDTTLSATITSPTSPVIVTETALLNGSAGLLTVPTVDLYTTNLTSVTSSAGSAFFGNPVTLLVDGQFGGPVNSTTSPFFPATDSTVTFNLDLAGAPGGYAIGELDSYSGWDSGRAGQGYAVAYSTVASPTVFIPLFTVTDWNANANVGIQPESVIAGSGGDDTVAQETSLTSQTGVLATNVAAIQYTFDAYDNGATGYREFDAVGATVPEPTAFAVLAGAGVLGLALLRRASRRRTDRRLLRTTSQTGVLNSDPILV